jgi:hypothetical protein
MAIPKIPQLGKNAASQMLPSRHALNTITAGDPVQRSLRQYGKYSPVDLSGLGQMNQAKPAIPPLSQMLIPPPKRHK